MTTGRGAARDLLAARERHEERADARKRLWCEGQGVAGETRNVSRSGMFIVADRTREVGEHLTLAFRDEEGGDVELEMEVMWSGRGPSSDRPGMGARIIGFRKGQEAYERFVSRHLAEESADDDGSAG